MSRRPPELHASLTAELAAGGMRLPATMEMTLVARCYERLGAHAVNIARRVAYLAGPRTRLALAGDAGLLGQPQALTGFAGRRFHGRQVLGPLAEVDELRRLQVGVVRHAELDSRRAGSGAPRNGLRLT
jgi:hypothetical protein